MITTHVLDISLGRPAADVPVRLEVLEAGEWHVLGEGRTDADGRHKGLMPPGVPVEAKTYRLRFGTGEYYASRQVGGFYPYVEIVFNPAGPGHFHVPLLLSPFGYSTYRGS